MTAGEHREQPQDLPSNSAVPVEPIGYTPRGTFFDADPWKALDAREPDLELRCAAERSVVGRVWLRASVEQSWYSSGHYRGTLADWVTDLGNLPVTCPKHGVALVPAQWVIDECRSPRHTANVRCTDRPPDYTVST